MPLRTLLRRTHLFLACTVGLILVFSGVTGSIIVFDHAIDEALNPKLLLVDAQTPNQPRLSYQTLLEKAEAQFKGTEFYASGMQAPRVPRSTQLVWMKSPDMHPMASLEVYLNPYTGEVLGERRSGKYFASYVYMIHHTLLMGGKGKLLLGYCGIGMLLMLFIGVYLWWPQEGKWKKALTLKRNAKRTRRLLDLHRVGGIYSVAVLSVSVFTGMSIIFPAFYAHTTELAAPVAPAPKPTDIAPKQRGGALMTVDDAIARGRQALDGSTFSRIYFDRDKGAKTWLMTFANPHDPKKSHGYDRVTLNPYSGEVVQMRRWAQASGGDHFLAWLFPLHSGEALGIAGRWLVCFCGWMPLMLLVTGIWRWRRKQAKRAKLVESALAPVRG